MSYLQTAAFDSTFCNWCCLKLLNFIATKVLTFDVLRENENAVKNALMTCLETINCLYHIVSATHLAFVSISRKFCFHYVYDIYWALVFQLFQGFTPSCCFQPLWLASSTLFMAWRSLKTTLHRTQNIIYWIY